MGANSITALTNEEVKNFPAERRSCGEVLIIRKEIQASGRVGLTYFCSA